jgi:uncharacterized caspase-like protein
LQSTIAGIDLDEVSMKDKSIAFARAAREADVALVYYSGQAMQRRGVNYLMPVDAVLHDHADLRRLTRVDDIVDDLFQGIAQFTATNRSHLAAELAARDETVTLFPIHFRGPASSSYPLTVVPSSEAPSRPP